MPPTMQPGQKMTKAQQMRLMMQQKRNEPMASQEGKLTQNNLQSLERGQ